MRLSAWYAPPCLTISSANDCDAAATCFAPHGPRTTTLTYGAGWAFVPAVPDAPWMEMRPASWPGRRPAALAAASMAAGARTICCANRGWAAGALVAGCPVGVTGWPRYTSVRPSHVRCPPESCARRTAIPTEMATQSAISHQRPIRRCA